VNEGVNENVRVWVNDALCVGEWEGDTLAVVVGVHVSGLGSGVQVVVQDKDREPVLENVRVGLCVKDWELVGEQL